MQQTGYIEVDGEKILVLMRYKNYGVSLKRRYSGKDGVFLTDESEYFSNKNDEMSQKLLTYLREGKTITV